MSEALSWIETYLVTPFLFCVVMAATGFATKVTIQRWQFSLRNRLIATTLVAVVRGLAVYVARR